MSLVNISVPNLIQGVSQQPTSQRFLGQCESQVNALSDVVDGLKKRPPLQLVKAVDTGNTQFTNNGTFCHFIKRTGSERYVVMMNNTSLEVYNLDTGAPVDITAGTSSASQTITLTNDAPYLASNFPRTTIKGMTVGDSTFLLNTGVTVTKSATTSAALDKQALVWVKQGDYNKKYTITVKSSAGEFSDVSVTYTSGKSLPQNETEPGLAADTTEIASGLAVGPSATHASRYSASGGNLAFDLGVNFTVTREKNLIVITRTSQNGGGDFTVEVSDGLGGNGLGVLYKEVDTNSNLPRYCKNGFRIAIAGSTTENVDDYYTEFTTQDGGDYGQGAWKETIGFGLNTSFASNKLPYVLKYVSANTFTLNEMDTADRQAGDDTTNPFPSFTGYNIEGMFFFKNRLGFLSAGNLVMSESGLGDLDDDDNILYQFMRPSVLSVFDTDPIDLSVASTQVSNCTAAIGFQEDLILFSEEGQFVLKGGTVLTNSSVAVTSITNYSYDSQVDPILLGSYVYFPYKRGQSTGVREFLVNSTTDTYEAQEITEHVPEYIGTNLRAFTGSSNDELLAVLASDTRTICVYKYFWSGQKKVLSAWSKFTIPVDAIDMQFLGSELFVICREENDKILICKFSMSKGDLDTGTTVHLDLRESLTKSSGTFNSGYANGAVSDYRLYTLDGNEEAISSGSVLGETMRLTATNSNLTQAVAGVPYTTEYVFSDLQLKLPAGDGRSPSDSADLNIRRGKLFFNNTKDFTITVTPSGSAATTSTFSSTTSTTSVHPFTVFADADNTEIKITQSEASECNFNSCEFDAYIHPISKRFG